MLSQANDAAGMVDNSNSNACARGNQPCARADGRCMSPLYSLRAARPYISGGEGVPDGTTNRRPGAATSPAMLQQPLE